MISSMQQRKRPQAGPSNGTNGKQTTELGGGIDSSRQEAAPLASLDCSITEPITVPYGSPPESGATDTPTLSGYFDCDELSDMIDDSLFEITNAGCLSKSVFNRRSIVCISGDKNVAPPEANKAQETADSKKSALDRGEKGDDASEPTTPTNGISQQQEKRLPIEPTLRASISAPNQLTQVSIVANYQPYDYSSTSSTPAQVRPPTARLASSQNVSAAHSNTTRQRSRSTRINSSSANNKSRQSEDSNQMASRLDYAKSAHRKQSRKARSNPDIRKSEEDSRETCLICQQQEQRLSKKKDKRRFTFSLFNLFTSGGSANGANNNKNNNNSSGSDNQALDKTGSSSEPDYCVHRQRKTGAKVSGGNSKVDSANQLADGSTRSSGRRRPKSDANHGTSGIKSRDSIKLTNQRKQRASSGGVTSSVLTSSSCTSALNQPSAGKSTTELLLDFPAKTRMVENGNDREIRQQSRRSYVQRGKANHEHAMGNAGRTGESQSLIKLANQSRPTKSVKFTTPDRVMFMSSNSNSSSASSSSSSGAGSKQKSSADNSGGRGKTGSVILTSSSAATTTAGVQPPVDTHLPAPIIKWPVPKLSSYSQTESSKRLEELLARYEDNRDLIVEINEKLKLTETIASPMSALDNQQQPPELQPPAQLNGSSTITVSYVEQSGRHHNHSDADTTIASTRRAELDNGDTDQNGKQNFDQDKQTSVTTATLLNSSSGDEAGFSKDWLDRRQKQTAARADST